MASGSASTKKKRKGVVLTKEKVKKFLICLINLFLSIITEKFGMGKSTVSYLKKNKEKIRGFQREMIDMGRGKQNEVR